MYFLYILECAGGVFYTGITTDVHRRFSEHQQGKGGHFTRAHVPIKICYVEECVDRSSASKREAEVKRLTRSQKQTLINRGMSR